MTGSTAYQVTRCAPGGPQHPAEAREWLARARSSLAITRSTGRGMRVEDLCPLARQAVERALQAVLVSGGLAMPSGSGALSLLSALVEAGIPVPERLARAADLFGAEEATGPVRIEKYYEAIVVATEAIRFAENRVGQ